MKKIILSAALMTLVFTLTSLRPLDTKNALDRSLSQPLFEINRSKDANEILYEVNLDNRGNLDTENPVRIYWIKHTRGGKTEPLSFTQRKLAYGLQFESISEKHAAFHFVSYKKRTLWINRKEGGKYCVNTISNNKRVIVKKIYIQIDGGSFLVPEISRVELHGEDPETGDDTLEIINP